jgi:hypothetical protein
MNGGKMFQKITVALLAATFLGACGGGGGGNNTAPTTNTQAPVLKVPNLGPLSIPKKLVTDPPFDLTPPTSDSSGEITYTSDNAAIATVSGKTVTIHGKGLATIAAHQAPAGEYAGVSTIAAIGVFTRLDGFVDFGGLLWMPITFTRNWADANTYCTTSTIDGQIGWRLPTLAELEALAAANAADGNDWVYMATWTSDASGPGARYGVHIGEDRRSIFSETDVIAVTCVK